MRASKKSISGPTRVITASYTALEDAKQEYKVRKGIYEYASSGYLTDGSDLELTRPGRSRPDRCTRC
jgi:hypothetical protein